MLFRWDGRNETGRPIAIECFLQLDEIIVTTTDFEILAIPETNTGIRGKIDEGLLNNL